MDRIGNRRCAFAVKCRRRWDNAAGKTIVRREDQAIPPTETRNPMGANTISTDVHAT